MQTIKYKGDKKMATEKYIEGYDKQEIFTRLWDNVKNPKGVVMIIHGMVEHTKRYENFANFLNKNGYITFAWDLRAHGKTVKNAEDVGKYSGDLFEDCVCDAMYFANMLNEKYHLPLVVLGHSYGSFVLQRFVEVYQNFSLAIFSGSASMKGNASVSMGLMVARMIKAFKGKNAKAQAIYNLTFKNYGKNFENGNWLTRDDKIFEEYNKDEFCGNVCSANFYVSMFSNMKRMYQKDNLNQVVKDKPFLILSGDKDPVGANGVLVNKLKELYEKLGVKDVQMKLYKDARHEILNETNKEEVFDDIINFCNKYIKEPEVKKEEKKKESKTNTTKKSTKTAETKKSKQQTKTVAKK